MTLTAPQLPLHLLLFSGGGKQRPYQHRRNVFHYLMDFCWTAMLGGTGHLEATDRIVSGIVNHFLSDVTLLCLGLYGFKLPYLNELAYFSQSIM